MRARRLALLVLAAASLLPAGSAVAGPGAVVQLALTTEPATERDQACISLSVTDGTTGQPLAAQVNLHDESLSGEVSLHLGATTDATGAGSLCFHSPSVPGFMVFASTVSADTDAGAVVAGSRKLTASSNSVQIEWGGLTGDQPRILLSPFLGGPSLSVGGKGGTSLQIANRGTVAATSMTVEAVVSGSAVRRPSASVEDRPCSGKTTLTCSVGQLGPGEETHVDVDFAAVARGSAKIDFTVRWHYVGPTSPAGADDSATTSVGFAVGPGRAALGLTFTRTRVTGHLGRVSVATARIKNTGSAAAKSVKVRFAVPAGLRITRLNGLGASCTIAARKCTIRSVPARSSRQLVLRFVPTRKGGSVVTVKVTALAGGSASRQPASLRVSAS